MSGVIFMSSDATSGDGVVETPHWNPLQCNICSEQYRDPCILQCYHSFCAECIEAKVEAGKVTCPICGCVSAVKEGCTLPSPDPLLKFLVESSQNDKVPCSNCEKAEAQMFFCNTCSQALCVSCREETHRARMFTRHEVVLLTKRAKDIQKECKLHKEPFILFSAEKKIMLCINCFRDMKVESRSHCVDLETAYKQGCQKLNNTMQSIRDLQHSVKETLLLLRALLEEIEQNAEREKQDILSLYNSIEEKISETKATLLQEIDRQYEEKERLFKNQLVHLSTFLPTLHVHLVTCAAFCSTANRYEFLDFTYVLMERLKSIIQVQHPLHPSQGSDIFTDYKTQFAKCLEPLLFPHGGGSPMTVPVSIASSVASQRLETLPTLSSSAVNLSTITYKPASNGGYRYSQNSAKFKLSDMTGYFTNHCKEFDTIHRELMQKVEGLKLGVQELQRDLTLRRCLAKEAAMGSLETKISQVEESLGKHLAAVEQKQPGLEKHWEECIEKLAGEQDVYRAQIQDVLRLKQETQSVKTILHRLSSFVSSIANVTKRLEPQLSVKQKEDQHSAILQSINTMQPDSQHRVDAIRTAQEERVFKAANLKNPLDEELIKTKGLLKAPIRSDCKDASKRESREIADAIAELEEERQAKEDKIRKETSAEYKKKETSNTDENTCKEGKINDLTEYAGAKENKMDENFGVVDSKTESKDREQIDLKVGESQKKADETVTGDQEPDVTHAVGKLAADTTGPGIDAEQSDITETVKKEIKSNELLSYQDMEAKNNVCPGISDLDLIQNTVSYVPDVKIDIEGADKKSEAVSPGVSVDIEGADKKSEAVSPGVSVDIEGADKKSQAVIPSANECSAVFTFESDFAGANPNSEITKDNAESKKVNTSKREKVTENESHRKRLSASISESDSDSKQEDTDTNEFNIQEIFGVKQLKHVERSTDVGQGQTTNGVDSSASGDDDEVYVAKSLPELAQVFEPGDLKPRRHSRRQDGSRSPKPGTSEPKDS